MKRTQASCSPTPRARTKSPNLVYRHGRSPTPRQKPLGEHIRERTEELKRNFHTAASQTLVTLVHVAITAESGESIAQVILQENVVRKKEIEHLRTTMQVAMWKHADMKSGVVMVAIVSIGDFISMLLVEMSHLATAATALST